MTADQIINICSKFSDEVNNGGFLQFIYNDDNASTNHLVDCLKAIGAAEMAVVCQTALRGLPSLPNDLEKRRAFLSHTLTHDILAHLQNCDILFNSLSDDLEEKLGNYIDIHSSEPNEDPSPNNASKDYYALYVKHNAKTMRSLDDLADPKLRRKHNKAMSELHKLNMEMFVMPNKGVHIVTRLLRHEDPRVRISAGAYCISAQVMVDEGKHVLKKISADPSLDRMYRFDAENCIEYCKPYKA